MLDKKQLQENCSAQQIINDHLLLKTIDVIKLLNISRGTFKKLKKKNNFPQPITGIGSHPMWITEEIIEWMRLAR